MDGERQVPAPAPELLAHVRAMGRVSTRRPRRALAVTLVVSLVWLAAWIAGPAAWIWGRALRLDLRALPRGWLIPTAALWLVSFVMPLGLAMLPRRTQVLHRIAPSRTAALLIWIALMVAALFARAAPGLSFVTTTRAQFASVTLQCTAALLGVALVPVALAAYLLRQAIPVGGATLALAIGCAGGALGGLALHLHCPWAEPLHVLLGHAMPVGIAALLSALLTARALQT
jgi:hypothetical protein